MNMQDVTRRWATAAALLLLAGLTLTIQDRLARGRGTTQALRVGE